MDASMFNFELFERNMLKSQNFPNFQMSSTVLWHMYYQFHKLNFENCYNKLCLAMIYYSPAIGLLTKSILLSFTGHNSECHPLESLILQI